MTSRVRQFCQTALESEADLGVFWSDVIWYTAGYLWMLVAIATVWNKDRIRQLYNTRFWETLVFAAIVSQCDGGLVISIAWESVRIILLMFIGFLYGL
jgi:hypothetical protein